MVLKERKMKLKEDVTGLKWYQDGSTYKRNIFSSGDGVDAKAVDAFVDNIVNEHNNHFEIKDPKITEELYFEIDGWNDYNGDNVYVEVNFNRDFDRDFNAEKWGEASYGGGRNEHGYVEALLNSGYLEKLGFKDAKVGGVGWNRGREVPRWNIDLYEFSDYTSDHLLKKPTSLDWHSTGNKINGTEPFTVEEGKEIRKVICDKVVELIKKYPNEIYNCSEPGLELKVVKSRPTSISWNGSYTHNAGYFNLDIDIRDFYSSKDEMTYDADEHRFTRVLKEHCAEVLNDYLADYALEVRPDSCEAHWYEGGDDSSVTYFEVAIGFKEAGLENPYDEYKKHTGLSYKGYFDEDPNPNRTFPKRPKKVAESRKRSRMRSLKENTVESYWLNGGDEALKNRFHEICSELGVWTKQDKGCESFGLYLRVGHGSDENDLRLRIVSPKYYLTDNGADMWAKSNSTEDFDVWVTKYIKEYSWLFKETDSPAYKHLVKSENPEPWTAFVVSAGSFRKALRQAFKSDECKYIDMGEQYDTYGEEHFEVGSTSDDTELSVTFNWCGDKNPDEYILFKFDNDLSYTTTMNGETVTGQGYEDAAKQYVLRIANRYAEGEFAKEYEPECYELRIYLKQDFYTKASKNIWQAIENILEGNCNTYTNYEPEDWVDDKAAVWTSIEARDLKRVLDWLKKMRPYVKLEIRDKDGSDVTSQFWTPKGSFKEGVSSNYVTPEQRQVAMNKARDYHNALMMAGLQDVDMEMERYVSNQPSERAWYNTIMNSLDGFIDSRVDEDDVDWRSYLTESKQVDECTCSGEFQRLAPVGKNTKMVNLAKKQSLGKKDKYNRLGENKSRRLQEEEIGREIYDFTNNDPDEDVFDVLLEVNGGAMRVEQSELDSLNIHLQNSVHGAYGLYIKGNGKPDVIINDFETGVRTPNYRYKIEVILVNDSDESQRAYSEINKYLADLLGY